MARTTDPKKRNDILQAARAIFNEKGYNDTRMAEIAENAGVASGTVYLYFKSKEDLVGALCEDYLSRLNVKVLAALDTSDVASAIANSVHIALAFAEEERDIVRLLDLRAALGKRCEMLPADRQLVASLAEVIKQRVDAGELRQYDPQVLAEVVSGLIEWVTKACLVWGSGEIERYEETLIKMLQSAVMISSKPGSAFYIPLMW